MLSTGFATVSGTQELARSLQGSSLYDGKESLSADVHIVAKFSHDSSAEKRETGRTWNGS